MPEISERHRSTLLYGPLKAIPKSIDAPSHSQPPEISRRYAAPRQMFFGSWFFSSFSFFENYATESMNRVHCTFNRTVRYFNEHEKHTGKVYTL